MQTTPSRTRTVALAVVLGALTLASMSAAAERGLGKVLAMKLAAAQGVRPETHATDFATDRLGCITVTARELRRFGYAGHAFLCEETESGDVLGAVLGRSGQLRCYITGRYAGDFCYDLSICGLSDSACVE